MLPRMRVACAPPLNQLELIETAPIYRSLTTKLLTSVKIQRNKKSISIFRSFEEHWHVWFGLRFPNLVLELKSDLGSKRYDDVPLCN